MRQISFQNETFSHSFVGFHFATRLCKNQRINNFNLGENFQHGVDSVKWCTPCSGLDKSNL